MLAHQAIDRVQIVAHPSWQEEIAGWAESTAGQKLWSGKFRGFTPAGETRQMSVWHGLVDIRAYAGDDDYVLIHDVARSLLSPKQITDCLEGAAGRHGSMPVLPMKDIVYYSRDGRSVGKLLDRGRIYAGQAPEVFVFGAYYEANRRLMPHEILKINGSRNRYPMRRRPCWSPWRWRSMP